MEFEARYVGSKKMGRVLTKLLGGGGREVQQSCRLRWEDGEDSEGMRRSLLNVIVESLRMQRTF